MQNLLDALQRDLHTGIREMKHKEQQKFFRKLSNQDHGLFVRHLPCLLRIYGETPSIYNKFIHIPKNEYPVSTKRIASCINDSSYISMDDWETLIEQDPRLGLITIYPDAKSIKGQCYTRAELFQSLISTVVYQWTGKDEQTACCPIYDIPYFKLPVPPVYIDLQGLIALQTFVSPEGLLMAYPRQYNLKFVKKDRVGTEFSLSSLHGHEVDIYTLVPQTDT